MMSGEPKTQEINNTPTYNYKCRIPQRMPPGRQRSTQKSRPHEQMFRPKSANIDDSNGSVHNQAYTESRSARPERERLYPAQKSPAPPVNKKTLNDKLYVGSAKMGKQVITVPVKQKFLSKATNHHKISNLPDQETIMKCEDLEIKQNYSVVGQLCNDLDGLFLDSNEEESITPKDNKVIKLKQVWQENITKFEEMKNELNDRQNAIMEVYASLRRTKEKLTEMGQNANLPSTDDLHVMNVANMTPNQLLKLCSEIKYHKHDVTKNTIPIDMKKLSDMPSKLIATCKQALETRKEFIEWFECLKNQEKGCSRSTLSKKINEFNAENDMLNSSLKNNENEFLKEISDFIRTCWNETITLQLRNEDLTNELTKVDTLNADLKKQVSSFEHQKSYTNKVKIEGLEKELKEEKLKRITMKDRLTRAEGQIKIHEERATLLESALNEARAHTRTLERTKQQLLEKNQHLQKELNAELNEVNECLKKNSLHLEEIAEAKEKLQAEKEDLKNKLEELSNHYNESINNMKNELNKNTANLIDVEKKYNEEMEHKKCLQIKVNSQLVDLKEYELRCEETMTRLQEKELELDKLIDYKNKFEQTQLELGEKTVEIEKYQTILSEHINRIQEIEKKMQETYENEKRLNATLDNKSKYIQELEIKQLDVVQQLQENESKMAMYEEQLLALKSHITKLKEHFGQFENLNDLHELINKQNSILNDTNRKNADLLNEIEKKKDTLKVLNETIIEHEELIKEKQGILTVLSKKQEEQISILQLNEQNINYNAEIENLINSIESKKEQIDQLEKIVLTLEDQNRKYSSQKRRDQDKIQELKAKIAEYEHRIAHKSKNEPSDIDNIIKILEDELGTQFEPQIDRNYYNTIPNENYGIDHNKYKYEQKQSFSNSKKDKIPMKMTVGNFADKNYLSSNNEKYKVDTLGRRKAITNIDTQKLALIEGKNVDILDSNCNNDKFICFKDNNNFYHPQEKFKNSCCNSKKDKMFKFASHQIM